MLSPSRLARWSRDLAVVALGAAFSFWLLARLRNDPPLFVGIVLVFGWTALLFLGWIVEAAFPLTTVIPRDSRRWRDPPSESNHQSKP